MANRYIPDLPSLIAHGEQNFALLMRLMQAKQADRLIHFDGGGTLQIFFEKSAPYTWFLKLVSDNAHHKAVGKIHLSVRLYLDAQIAEVYASADNKRLLPIFALPNKSMAQIDEKEQLNMLLHEILSHASRFGLAEPNAAVGGF